MQLFFCLTNNRKKNKHEEIYFGSLDGCLGVPGYWCLWV